MKTNLSDPGYIPGPAFIPGCVSVRLIWTLPSGKTAQNILHGSYTATPTISTGTVNTLFTTVSTAFTSSGYAAQTSTGFKLHQVAVRDLAPTTVGGVQVGFGEVVSNLPDVPGTDGTGQLLPPGVAFVISLKTGLSLQANRGRVYLCGYTETVNLTGGVPDPAVGIDGVTFINAVRSGIATITGGGLMCIAHKARAGYTSPTTGVNHPPRSPGTVAVQNVVALDNLWDSSRLRGKF